jgi:hypothetical protein
MSTPTVDVSVGSADPVAARRGVDSRWGLIALILLVGVLRWLPLRNNGWFLDDNLYLIIAHQSGFSLHWLFSNLFEHFGILYRAAFTFIYHVMPISWRWGLLGSLILLAGAVYLLDRILRMLLDSVWAPLLLAAAFGLSVLLIEALEWVSSGLQNFPTAFGDLLCLYGYLRYLDRPSRRWIIVSALGLAFALGFYEKASFMIGYLPMIRIAFLTRSVSWREIRAIAVRERAFWLTIIAVLILWFIGLKIAHAGGVFIDPTPSEWVEYWRIMWGQTLVPAVFGLHIPYYAVTHRQVIEGIVLEVVAVAAIALSIWRKRTAWRAWLVLIIAVLANGILVAEERVVVLKAPGSIAGDSRYLLDFSWMVPLMIAFAFSSATTFWPRASRLTVPLRLPGPGRPRLVALGVAVIAVAYVISAQANTQAIQSVWLGGDALEFEQNFANSLKLYDQNGATPVVADGTTPYEVLADIYTPYDLLSYVMPFYAPKVQVDGPIHGTLLQADPLGALNPAKIKVLETFRYSGTGRCVSNRTKTPRLMLADIKVHAPTSAGPFYLVVKHGSSTAPFLMYTGTLKDPPTGQDEYIDLDRGPGASIGYMGATLPDQLFTEVPGHSSICLRSLQIVTLSVP